MSDTNPQHIAGLILKKLLGVANPQDLEELDKWKAQAEVNRVFLEDVMRDGLSAGDLTELEPKALADRQERLFGRIENACQADSPQPVHRMQVSRTAWFRYAAAVLIILTCSFLYYKFSRTSQPEIAVVTAVPPEPAVDITPDFNRAVLTLSDGRQIALDSAASKTIMDQNLSIENADGQLIYKKGGLVATNTMSTPKGGQYKLTLSDGTKVWLNAASSITYPTAFNEKTRTVSVTGEAYFDVAHDAQKPFHVVVQNSYEIQVLGTQFNVNAYADEDRITTALINGAVNIKAKRFTRRLIPGQIAEVVQDQKGEQEINIIDNVSMQSVTAWKNGVFNFNNKSLGSIMRQLSRWYDIEVVYSGKIPEKQFWGEVGMDVSLEDVLEFLRKSNVKFTYQKGRKLIVGQ